MRLVHFILVFIIAFSATVQTNPFENKEARLAVSDSLLIYINQLENLATVDKERLASDIENFEAVNVAEVYLKQVILARLAIAEINYSTAIEHLESAKQQIGKLPKQMQVEPMYFDYHRLLADVYLSMENYELAYHHRRQFLIAYANDLEAKEQELLESLEQKYQIEQKEQVNLLLAQQAELKQAKIRELEREKQQTERNVYLLIAIGVVFILMILRQLGARQKLKLLSRTDTLTGLLNRSAIFEVADQLVKTANIKQQELSLLIIDVDYFKQINGEYGHQAGDAVLKKVSKLGKEVMRSRDVFARFGSEEFIAILPQASLDEAGAIARHFKDKVNNASFNDKGLLLEVTLSIGVASLSQVKVDTDSLVKAAEFAMQQAKLNGHNQVTTYNAEFEQ